LIHPPIIHPINPATTNRIYCTGARYFDHQEVVFDGFKAIPANSKALICFHPHGILTIGWALTSTSPALLHSKVKWLATEALLRLPFISDFLSWNGTCRVSCVCLLAKQIIH
jgi:hypothetical protein